MLSLKSGLNQRWLKILLGLIITAIALWLSFRKLDWQILKETFLKVNLFWVALAVVNTVFTVYALGWRWKILLKPQKNISFNSLFKLNIISQYINIIIPGRFGELLRAYLASKQYQISSGYVIGTIAIEKAFDFFAFVFLWITVPVFLAVQEKIRGYKAALFFCFVAISFISLLIWQPKVIIKWVTFFLRILPGKLRQKLQGFFEKAIEAFGILKSAKLLFFVIILTFIFILSQVLTNFLLFKALNLNLSIWAGLFLLLAIQLVNIPPSAPGKIGVFEYAVILALSVFNISKNLALSYGIILHLVAFLPKILLGLIFISFTNISLKQEKGH